MKLHKIGEHRKVDSGAGDWEKLLSVMQQQAKLRYSTVLESATELHWINAQTLEVQK